MPNLIVFSSIITLYVCEFICKGWVWEIGEESSFKDVSVQFATSSREVTRKKATCEAHDWKLKSHARLLSSRVFRKKGYPMKYPRKSLFDQKDKVLYQILYPHHKFSHYPRIVRNTF